MIGCTRQISCLNRPARSQLYRTLSTSAAADIQSVDQSIKPVWKYSPGIFVKPESKAYNQASKLSTYRRLRRLVQRTAQGQAQMWYEERSSKWSDNQKHLEQVNPHGLYQYSPKWVQFVRSEYERHRNVTDPLLAAQLHNDAMEYAQLLQSSIDHSHAIFEAGWGLKQDTKKQVASVARRVGLQVTESPLEKEMLSWTETNVRSLPGDAELAARATAKAEKNKTS